MYFISQAGQHDCAFTCLKILLANYHHDKNYLYLYGEDRAYSFQDLKAIAKEHHMEINGVRVGSVKELIQGKEFPLIVTLKRKENYRHSVVVLNITPKHAYIYDPELGKRKVRLDDFLEKWDSKALIVSKEEGYTKYKCETVAYDFIDKKDKITLPLWQLLSGASLLLGMYFINSKSYFFIPVILLSLFVICEILFRKNLVLAMRRMDENIFNYHFRASPKEFKPLYVAIEKYRYVAFSTIPNFINSTLIAMAITAILIMNSVYNIIYVALALILAIAHVYIYSPYFNKKSVEIGETESEIDDLQNEFQFRSVVSKAHESAYQLGLSQNLITYIEIAALLMTSITMMSTSGVVNVVYVIFYLCISVYLKDTFRKLLECSSQSEQFDNQLAKILHYIDLSTSNNSIE